MKRLHSRVKHIFSHAQTRRVVSLLALFVLVFGFATFSQESNHRYVEVGFSAVSPSGEAGGHIVPASCDSTNPPTNNAPNAGQACSGSNACGTLSGTYDNCGNCSVSAPSLPANYGKSCTSSANSCGQTNSGTIGCSGACSAAAPSDASCACGGSAPYGYGNACTSAANSCGQTNSGTIGCSGACSASAPPDSSCSSSCSTVGQACVSSPNSCGQTNTGTINSNCLCSATPPPDSSCPPTPTCPVGYIGSPPNCEPAPNCPVGYTGTPPNCILAPSCPSGYTGTPPNCIPNTLSPSSGDVHITAPTRVRLNATAVLTWWASNVTSCSLSGPNTSDSATADDGGNVSTRNTTSAPITGQSIFTVTCQASNGTISASATVNLIPNTIEI